MAKLLRQKSALIVSFGSCACFGGIPGLANVTNRKDILEYVYWKTPSSDNVEHVLPTPHWHAPEGDLETAGHV